jgi:hypothetical protein
VAFGLGVLARAPGLVVGGEAIAPLGGEAFGPLGAPLKVRAGEPI